MAETQSIAGLPTWLREPKGNWKPWEGGLPVPWEGRPPFDPQAGQFEPTVPATREEAVRGGYQRLYRFARREGGAAAEVFESPAAVDFTPFGGQGGPGYVVFATVAGRPFAVVLPDVAGLWAWLAESAALLDD
jgi:hypothetical protein